MNLFINTVTRLCKLFAVLGGILLLLIAAMTMVSIFGRFFFDAPIRGDFEMTKQGMGLVVASFIPYCILNGGNLIVDFFTTKASENTQRVLDTVGALFTAAGLLMFAYKATEAIADVRESNEVSGNIDLPVWWIYAGMAPSLWLAVLAGVVLAIKTWRGDQQESEAEMILREAAAAKALEAEQTAANVHTSNTAQGATA
jgi:TRAP-type C4-dicarboxylate transport system permease small subunit